MKWVPRILFTLIGYFPLFANADQARAPYDYIKEVEGGKYVFVMLAQRDFVLLDPDAADDVGVVVRNKEIRATYSESGLYPAGRKTPLWTLSWYAFTAYPSSNGEHLVRVGPWASSTNQLALAFYSRGKMVKKYLISDLVKDPSQLRRTVSHFFWMAGHHYDDKAQRFHLKTVEGTEFQFSMATGEIIP